MILGNATVKFTPSADLHVFQCDNERGVYLSAMIESDVHFSLLSLMEELLLPPGHSLIVGDIINNSKFLSIKYRWINIASLKQNKFRMNFW